MTALPNRLAGAAYVAGWKVVGVLPGAVAAALFRAGADLASWHGGRGAQQLRRNLRRVVGPGATESALDATVRAAMRSYARYWLETFRLPRLVTTDVLSRVRTEGAEHLDAAHAAGRGVILALPHSGNWDVAGLWLIERGLRFTTVAERVQPESLFDRFVTYRERLGMEILPLHGGSRPLLGVLAERLQAGGCVCLVAERDLSRTGEDRSEARTGARRQPPGEDRSEARTGARRQPAGEDRSDEEAGSSATGARRQPAGVVVDFFDEPARMPPGPALLAATTGAALLPVTVYFTAHGWGQWIGAPIELGDGRLRERVTRGTQALADSFAERIAQHPADWHMLQPIWSADARVTSAGPITAATAGAETTHAAPTTAAPKTADTGSPSAW